LLKSLDVEPCKTTNVVQSNEGDWESWITCDCTARLKISHAVSLLTGDIMGIDLPCLQERWRSER